MPSKFILFVGVPQKVNVILLDAFFRFSMSDKWRWVVLGAFIIGSIINIVVSVGFVFDLTVIVAIISSWIELIKPLNSPLRPRI